MMLVLHSLVILTHAALIRAGVRLRLLSIFLVKSSYRLIKVAYTGLSYRVVP